MAGLAVGSELARDRSVLVLEREATPAQHTTGRSAALFIEPYGGDRVRPLTKASRPWLDSLGEGFADHPLLSPRGLLTVARHGEEGLLDEPEALGDELLDSSEALDHIPVLRPELVGAARYDTTVQDIDVAGCITALRRALRSRRGRLEASHPVTTMEHHDGSWTVTAGGVAHRAAVVVDAAGAWADQVASMAGLAPLGLRPLRRTICTFRAPDGLDHERWPVLLDAAERFYLKPEPGSFLASPVDETMSEPVDPRPDELDVASALDEIRALTTLAPRSILTSWAGLRTFTSDRGFVLGPDPRLPSFAWCAGHGGFGIQAGIGAALATVALIDGNELPSAPGEPAPHPEDLLADRLLDSAGR
jgi:D-arginine dehydrogenase